MRSTILGTNTDDPMRTRPLAASGAEKTLIQIGDQSKIMVMKTVETVNAAHQPYAPHLLVNELSLDAGKEWTPMRSDWTLILLGSGNGYWIEEQSRRELPSGSLVLTAG